MHMVSHQLSAEKASEVCLHALSADVQGLRPALQNYLTCGSNPAQSIDFFGLNCYEW